VNSLETPVLEFYSPRAYAIPPVNRRAENLSAISKLWERAPTDVTVTGADGERLERGRRAVEELNRGFALLLSKEPNRVPGALELLNAAIEMSPDHTVLKRAVASAHFDLGLSLQRSGRVKAAIVQYRRAVSLNPNQAETRHNLGNALGAVGEMDQATLHLREAVRIKPSFAGAHNSIGYALLVQGQSEEAISHYAQAVELSPQSARFHNDLGVAHVVLGQIEAATHHFGEASRLRPTWAAPLAAMAWTLATYPNPDVVAGEQAVELARRAKELTSGKHPVILDTLAAAYARAGRYKDAIRAAEDARTAALTAGDRPLAGAIEERLALYRAHQPFFERHTPAMLQRLKTPFSTR
jgi:spermidine synthase